MVEYLFMQVTVTWPICFRFLKFCFKSFKILLFIFYLSYFPSLFVFALFQMNYFLSLHFSLLLVCSFLFCFITLLEIPRISTYLLGMFVYVPISLSSSEIPVTHMLGLLILSHRYLRLMLLAGVCRVHVVQVLARDLGRV